MWEIWLTEEVRSEIHQEKKKFAEKIDQNANDKYLFNFEFWFFPIWKFSLMDLFGCRRELTSTSMEQIRIIVFVNFFGGSSSQPEEIFSWVLCAPRCM